MSRFAVAATLILILLLSLSSASGVMADGPGGTWTSWPFIQNPGTEPADVTLEFYDLDGNLMPVPASQATHSIAGGESWYVPVWSIAELGSSFSGSMVVSSDKPVIAVSNQVNEYSAGNSYSGIEQGATSLSAPSIHANDWEWWAEISVQNTTADEATVQVSFVPSNYGNAYTTPEVTIPAYSSKRFSTETYAAQLGQFVGAATITCTNGKDVVGAVEEWNTGAGYLTIAYNTIPSGEGGSNVYFPSQHNNNWGWFAWNFLQNLSSDEANITVTWSGTGAPAPWNTTIPGNGSIYIATGDYMGYAGGTDFVGGLTVESTNGKPIVGICNEVQGTAAGVDAAISYNGFGQ